MSELLTNVTNTTHSAKDDSRPSMMLDYRYQRIPKLDANFEIIPVTLVS